MDSAGSELKGPDLRAGIEIDELRDGQPFLGHAGGEAVVVVRRGQDCFAVAATCTHYSGPLAEGLVVDGTIRCPWHHARFDLHTGAPRGGPGITPLGCFEVIRQGDLIKVGIKRPAAIGTTTATPAATGPVTTPSSVVIVGSGPAGMAVADTLRAEGYAGPITLVGEEGLPVDRPNLSKDYLAGTVPEEWMHLHPAEDLRDRQIALLQARALRLDVAGKRLAVEGGEDLDWGALVLATGASPHRLPIPGADLPAVHLLRTLADSRAIIAAADRGARQAVVIGGGFIGLEVAASLRARKLEVTVVLKDSLPLQRVLGDALATFVRGLHAEHGVTFVQGSPSAVDATGVTLASGQKVAADLVVMGVGVRPRVDLAQAAGLRIDDGIVVDDRLRTSAPDVFAVGDVARFPFGAGGQLIRVEHFVHAERMGFVAARNLLGHDQPFRHAPFFWSQHYDVPINHVGAGPWDEVQMVGDPGKRDVLAVYRRQGRAVALASIYRDKDSLRFEDLLERGDDIGIEALIAEARVQLSG
jgi:apoptosis-inducing factor 3